MGNCVFIIVTMTAGMLLLTASDLVQTGVVAVVAQALIDKVVVAVVVAINKVVIDVLVRKSNTNSM